MKYPEEGARAAEDSVVTEIRSDTFLKYIREKPNAVLKIMQNLAKETISDYPLLGDVLGGASEP